MKSEYIGNILSYKYIFKNMEKRKTLSIKRPVKKHKVNYTLDTLFDNDRPIEENINNVQFDELNKILCEVYSNPIYIMKYQYIIDRLRQCKTINKPIRNILISYPFLLVVPNFIQSKDIEMIKNFMKSNNKNTYNTIGDNRKYHFSESYQVYFPNNKLEINEIHSKGDNSPTFIIDKIIQNLCQNFYLELKKNGINYGTDERQLNVFPPFAYIKNDPTEHLRWHRDCDGKNIPEYTMVILLDTP